MLHSSLLNKVMSHVSLQVNISLICSHTLTDSHSFLRFSSQLLITLHSSIPYLDLKCLQLSPMIEWVPFKPILVIILKIMLSELSAIWINIIHLFENYNSGSITSAICGNKLQWVVQRTLHTLRIVIIHAM